MDEKEFKFLPNKSCRVCLQTYSDMNDLFREDFEYNKMLQQCGRIEVSKSDGLPEVICEYCSLELVQAHNFYTKCQDSDKRLRNSLITHAKEEKLDDLKISFDFQITNESQFVDIKTEYEPNIEDILKQTVDDDDFNNDEDILHHDSNLEEKHRAKKHKRKKNNTIKSKKLKRSMSKKKRLKKQENLEKYPRECPQCGIVLSCKSVFLVHYRTHTNERPFKCTECTMTFKAKCTLDVHLRRCHITDYKKTHTCEECKKSFFCSTELRVHMRSHTGDTPYRCKLCDKQYTQSASLKRHVRSQHTGERPYQCSMCPKNFVTLTEMRKHEVIHSDERKHICDVCKFAFKCKATLRIHLATHSQMKRFVCDQCGASFHTKANLTIHQSRKHSEFAGQCIVCNKEYSNLKDHMRTHTGETPFHCGICGKKFSLKASFYIHMQIHQSDKHPCQYQGCNKSFPKLNFLEYHVLKHHKKFTPYVCKYCDKGYFRFCDIKSHMNVNHADKDVTYLKKITIPPSFFSDANTENTQR